MQYMLDTNICVFAIRNRSTTLLERLRQCEDGSVVLSVIALAELEFGVNKSQHPTRAAHALENFLAPFDVLALPALATIIYGQIRFALEKKGTPIGPLDLFTAAHALACDATLVTNNTREFQRVPELRIVDWTVGV